MQRKFLKLTHVTKAIVISFLLLTSACTQMMRHSNTLVFGTDTNIGLKVGQDVNQIPSIEVGYGRQEAAFVPLLANTASSNNGEGKLNPCVPSANSDCHFRASHNGSDKDSYSTIASFGSDVGTSNDSNGVSAEVSVAQYFATGIAAQHLVLTGGANIIQAGGNTEAKADAAADAANDIAAAQAARSSAAALQYDEGRANALVLLGGDSDANVDVNSAGFSLLHQRMGAACSQSDIQSELSDNDQQRLAANTLSIDSYLSTIRDEIPSCFDNLIQD